MNRYKIILKKMLNNNGKHYAMELQYIRGDFKYQYSILRTIKSFVEEYKKENGKDDITNFTITKSGGIRIKSGIKVEIEEIPRIKIEKEFLYYDKGKIKDIYEDIIERVGELKGGNLIQARLLSKELPSKYTIKEIEYKYQGDIEGILDGLDSYIEDGKPRLSTLESYYKEGVKEFYLADICRYTKKKEVIGYYECLKEIKWLDNTISHTRPQKCNEDKLKKLYNKREELYRKRDEIGEKLGTSNLDEIVRLGDRNSGYIVILAKLSLVKSRERREKSEV